MSGTNLQDLLSAIQLELSKLLVWLQANKLTLNLCKTHYMVFQRASIKTINIRDTSLSIDSTVLEHVQYTKFLGIVIDNKLQWNNHISYMLQNRNLSNGKESAYISEIIVQKEY